MKKKQQLLIILPEQLEDLPVRVIRNSNHEELILGITVSNFNVSYSEFSWNKEVLIWRQNDYLKVSLDEIQWIEADGSYSVAHLTRGRDLTISFNLSVIHRELPDRYFVRLHRSYIININHMESLRGNCVKIGNRLLSIGREYRETFFSRFIFLGVRRHRK